MLRKVIIWTLLPLVALIVAFCYQSYPMYSGTIQHPIHKGKIVREKDHGVPHIYSDNMRDAMFLVGYAQAQDRLWQIDLVRRAASGRLSEILGEKALEFDQWMRTIGLNQLSKKLIDDTEDHVNDYAKCFLDGVNYAASQMVMLPIEYQILRASWEDLTLQDLYTTLFFGDYALLIHKDHELLRYRVQKILGKEWTDLVLPFDIKNLPNPYFTLSNSELIQSNLHSSSTTTSPPKQDIPINPELPKLDPLLSENDAGGSNAWVISGKYTASGKPLVAGDTHLGYGIPSFWYQFGLTVGDRTISGFAMTGQPAIVVGKNEYLAWGVTSYKPDTTEWCFEELNDQNQYRVDDHFEDLEITKETIYVYDTPQDFVVRRTRNGPIFSSSDNLANMKPMSSTPSKSNIVMSLRLSNFHEKEPETSVAGMFDLMLSTNTTEFRAACGKLMLVHISFVYADVSGNIGIQTAGRVPIRKFPGNYPVNGWNSDFSWKGFIPVEELPYSINPEKGYLINCNNIYAEDGYKWYNSIGIEYKNGRCERADEVITEKIKSGHKFTLDDMNKMQLDTVDVPTRQMLPKMLKLTRINEKTYPLLSMMEKWDADYRQDSRTPHVFALWHSKVLSRILADELNDDELNSQLTNSFVYRQFLHKILTDEKSDDHLYCDDIRTEHKESCADLLTATLEEVEQTNASSVKWGDVHQINYEHKPFGKVPILGKLFNRDLPVSGKDTTLNCNGWHYNKEGFDSIHGATSKIVTEVGGDDGEIGLDTGISGNPLHKYYDSFIPGFHSGELMPWKEASEAEGYILEFKN